jgi:MFS family permease
MDTVLGITTSRILAALSWRWFYRIMTIPGGLAFVLILVLLPETKHVRSKDEIGKWALILCELLIADQYLTEGRNNRLPPGQV